MIALNALTGFLFMFRRRFDADLGRILTPLLPVGESFLHIR